MDFVARYVFSLLIGLTAAVAVLEMMAVAFLGIRRLLHDTIGRHTPTRGAPTGSPA